MIKSVYQITNIKTKKFYIGSSTRTKSRWNEHRKFLKLEKHHNILLQRAWNKYGEEPFLFEIIKKFPTNCGSEEILRVEQEYLDTYVGSKNCYNISKFASKPDTDLNKKPVMQLDIKSQKLIKTWASAIDVENTLGIRAGSIYNVCKGILASAGKYKWTWADRTLASQYTPNNNSHGGHRKREICLINPITKEKIETYDSLAKAAEIHKCRYECILMVCKGKRLSYKGKVFKYSDDVAAEPEKCLSNKLANLEPGFLCLVCGINAVSPKSLATHIQFSHKISSREYTIKYVIKNMPTCAHPTCLQEPRYVSFGFKKYCKEHQRLAMSNGGKTKQQKKTQI